MEKICQIDDLLQIFELKPECPVIAVCGASLALLMRVSSVLGQMREVTPLERSLF